jgi:hypothetical protein
MVPDGSSGSGMAGSEACCKLHVGMFRHRHSSAAQQSVLMHPVVRQGAAAAVVAAQVHGWLPATNTGWAGRLVQDGAAAATRPSE